MDYSLLKTITPSLPYLKPDFPFIHLTATPGRDLINPGIGQITRLYSFYVPLTGLSNPYEITKIDNKSSNELNINNQEGFGEENVDNVDKTDNGSSTSVEQLDENNIASTSYDEKKPVTISSSKNLDKGVIASFQHPKIKVGKVVIKQQKESNKIQNAKNSKVLKHKFKVI